jgi:hypothetical protein
LRQFLLGGPRLFDAECRTLLHSASPPRSGPGKRAHNNNNENGEPNTNFDGLRGARC